MQRLTFFLVCSLFLCGVLATVVGSFGLLYPFLSVVLIVPIVILFLIVKKVVTSRVSRNQMFLIFALVLIWVTHATGILVPETGFDALWYHLPIVANFVQLHRVVFLPAYYQSLNPMFSDLIFLLGFQVGHEFGAKVVALIFGVTLVMVSYQLSRRFLDRSWALFVVLIISSFQVVAWQSSSFYVDIAKAVWEVAAVWMLLKKEYKWSGLFFGASLATKLFSIFLWPIFLLEILCQKGPYKRLHALQFLALSVIIALPFYIFTSIYAGTPFYSFAIHTDKLAQIGGEASPFIYAIQRTIALPTSLTQLTLFSRDYTTLLFLLFVPLLFFIRPKNLFLTFFAISQWLIWWYVPPLSTRYALSGFIVLALLTVQLFQKLAQEKPALKNALFLTIFLSIIFNLAPRVFVTQRNLKYIFGGQTQRQYLQQFYDGNIDHVLKEWYNI